MIFLYSGVPGTGKSLHSVADIRTKLKKGQNVIANFPIRVENIKSKKIGNFVYVSNEELTVKFLVEYALKNHVEGKEAQTLLVIDEAQSLFNPRDFNRIDRKDFNYFFSLHRKLGYSIILVTQNDRLLDRQIRCQIEYEVKHRKINNFKTIGMLLPVQTFVCINTWYGVREKLGIEFFTCSKRLTSLYDSYALFDLDKLKDRFKVALSDDEVEVDVDVLSNDEVKVDSKCFISRLKFKLSNFRINFKDLKG